MFSKPVKKQQVTLEDYNYRLDIENRVLLSSLTEFDLEILTEIIHNSLHFPISDLTEAVECTHDQALLSLIKLSQTGLFTFDNRAVTVNKELRKYFENQIEKFEENFSPGISYILSNLNKVPIHALPNWYAIPRSTNNITESIIDQYLQTPKKFEQHILEVAFENPLYKKIFDDVIQSETYSLPASIIREKYSLSREEFEEIMLYLEFNFLCFIIYKKIDGNWEEQVTLFKEWKEYQLHLREVHPKAIDFGREITPFRFIKKLNHSLKQGEALSDEMQRIVDALPETWMNEEIDQQAIMLYRTLELFTEPNSLLKSEKVIRSVEKALKRVVDAGWIYFDDFIESNSEPVNQDSHVVLTKKGTKWEYKLPQLSDIEVKYIKELLCTRFFQSSVIEVGNANNYFCFCVTPFGKSILL